MPYKRKTWLAKKVDIIYFMCIMNPILVMLLIILGGLILVLQFIFLIIQGFLNQTKLMNVEYRLYSSN